MPETKKPDFYRIKSLESDLVATAGRLALIDALAPGRDDTVKTMYHIRNRWAKLIKALSSVQYQYNMLPSGQWGYLYNCPVAGIVGRGSRVSPCGRRKICPWCWTRSCYGLIKKIVEVGSQQCFDTIEMRLTLGPMPLERVMEMRPKDFLEHRVGFEHEGALVSLVPVKIPESSQWYVTARSVIVVDPSVDSVQEQIKFDLKRTHKSAMEPHCKPTDDELVRIASRFIEYPGTLWDYPESMAQYIESSKGVRSFSKFGAMRESNSNRSKGKS